MEKPLLEGWITINEAKDLVGYTPTYLRRLAADARITAHKVGRDWLLNRASLLNYQEQMALWIDNQLDRLGSFLRRSVY